MASRITALPVANTSIVNSRQYRLLTRDDTIQRGDEILADDTVSWVPLVGWEIGMRYDASRFVPVRRLERND